MPFFERWERFKQGRELDLIVRFSEILHYARARGRDLEDLNDLCWLECQNPGAGTEGIDYVTSKLNQISADRYGGTIVRARTENVFFGEQFTKRAFYSDYKYALAKEIRGIQFGTVLSYDNDFIKDTFARHYI